jgi:protoporphyrinogen oxidase
MAKPILNHQPFRPFEKAELHYDVAVIGGGVSGVYTAWRLKQEKPELKVAVFEYGDRIGGRLYSYEMPGMPHVKAELGGMRWLTSHQIVVGLIGLLDLGTREFPMGADGGANNLMYLRRRQLRVRELSDPAKVPYLMEIRNRLLHGFEAQHGEVSRASRCLGEILEELIHQPVERAA